MGALEKVIFSPSSPGDGIWIYRDLYSDVGYEYSACNILNTSVHSICNRKLEDHEFHYVILGAAGVACARKYKLALGARKVVDINGKWLKTSRPEHMLDVDEFMILIKQAASFHRNEVIDYLYFG